MFVLLICFISFLLYFFSFTLIYKFFLYYCFT
jgi:hypothetical protein